MKTSTWQNKRLKDICLEREGLRRGPFGSAIKKQFFVPDGYKVYEQANAIYDDADRGKYFISESKYRELENFEVKEGDFIVSCSGTLGKISQIPKGAKPGVINQALLRIRLKNGIVLNNYFLYYFRSSFFQKKIVEESQGTAMSNLIGIKDFKEIEIPIPSIEEQTNVVSKIEELFSELDKSIEQLKTAQQQIKVYRQSVLKWAFEGKLTNDWRISNDDISSVEDYLKSFGAKEHRFESNEGLPKSWRKLKLNYLCERVSVGHVGPTSQFYSPKGTGIPFLRSQNVRKGFLDFEGLQYINKEFHRQLKKSQLQAGDLLIVRVGANRGDACIVPDNIGEINCANIVFARPRKGLNKFLGYFFLSPLWTDLIEKVTTGSAQGVVNTKIVAETIVNFPPIQEQAQIIYEIEKLLSVADKLEETITNSLQQAEALRQSILKKAFEGKLFSD